MSTMKAKTSSRLAWSIGIVSIALILAQLVVMFIDRNAALRAAGIDPSSRSER
jgi:divalent metal cation (Fe/Co/Zn/Cd) transporter